MIYRPDLAEVILDSVAVLVSDMETGEILFVNTALEMMFGSTIIGAMQGMNVDDLVPTESQDKHSEYRAEYAANPRTRPMGARLTLKGQRLDGTVFPVRVILIPCMLAARKCVVALVFDMTESVEGGQ